tara:strand:+ start:829 stop:1623 length:795 start_codon:yes stop_codon:yes gene_type:complete
VKKKYFIILKLARNQISLGDIIRALEFFKNQNYEIVTDYTYNQFFKNFNKKNILTFSKFKKKRISNKKIINLIIGKKIKDSVFDINDHLKKKINKISTYKIFKELEKFKKKVNTNKLNKKKYMIGINKIVPRNWVIKSYPQKNWEDLSAILRENKNIKVSFQKKMSLKNYVKWIKSCDIIISVVGLGVHIAKYFDKKIIMLVGPTDFFESKNDGHIHKVFPDKRCHVHKRKLNLKYKNCNCMKNIKIEKIINKLDKITNYESRF